MDDLALYINTELLTGTVRVYRDADGWHVEGVGNELVSEVVGCIGRNLTVKSLSFKAVTKKGKTRAPRRS